MPRITVMSKQPAGGRCTLYIRLGVGHQSPDYQWWHGQPALDGDLIRIRHIVATALRRGALPHDDRRSKDVVTNID